MKTSCFQCGLGSVNLRVPQAQERSTNLLGPPASSSESGRRWSAGAMGFSSQLSSSVFSISFLSSSVQNKVVGAFHNVKGAVCGNSPSGSRITAFAWISFFSGYSNPNCSRQNLFRNGPTAKTTAFACNTTPSPPAVTTSTASTLCYWHTKVMDQTKQS